MYKLKSNNIKDFSFEIFANLKPSELDQAAKDTNLSSFNSWMLPQINAYLATWELKKNDKGLIDPKATAKKNISTSWEIGLWRVLTRMKRGSLVKKQSAPEGLNYSALVPLPLAAQKRFNNIPYSAWDIDESCPLIESELLETMLCRNESILSLGSDRLVEIREAGLTVKTGSKAGRKNSPTAQWKLSGLSNTEFAGAPAYLSTMMCQIWVAHPSLRTEYMILDPVNWDKMPEPLVSTEVFISKNTARVADDVVDMPWDC